jgi:predicted house-cleaning noncanonical NTP pyrophosphatase (MazG superfamily)
METNEGIIELNAKDLYMCLKLSTLSSMVGTNPPREEGEIDIALAVESIVRICQESENTRLWRVLRSVQCEELGDWMCCKTPTIQLTEYHDELLVKIAAKLQRFNNELVEVDYMEQLNNLEFIDKVIEERTLNKKKRLACFISQLKLTVKAKRFQKNEQKDLGMKIQRSGNSLGLVASSGLNFIPQNVNYETGTHIELDLIGASIFMPWKWVRVKELYPKNASISVFSNSFAGDLQ